MGNAAGADRALYTASRKGDVDSMRTALKEGANPNFVADPHGWTPLHVSAAYNKEQGCRLLMTAGADWSIKDKAGLTPIELAKKRNVEIWKYLDDVANGRTEAKYASDKFEDEQPINPQTAEPTPSATAPADDVDDSTPTDLAADEPEEDPEEEEELLGSGEEQVQDEGPVGAAERPLTQSKSLNVR
eukprot:TRINITY_DN3309_c0_g1_i8.p1 TRINITY_DN3309_c0_g1~~TRINITY_DN3309_c0_g1_i8.p1  ORF type:complete len:187 (-),score=51.05 TRINITY_DN3309_c0_g1_i8:299-859(-)